MAAIATELPAHFGAFFSMDLLIKAKFCRCVQVKLGSVQCVLHVWYTCDSLCQYSAVVMLGEGGGYAGAVHTHLDIHNKLNSHSIGKFYFESTIS